MCDTSGSMHEQLLAQALGEDGSHPQYAGLRHTRVRMLAADINSTPVGRVSRAPRVAPPGDGGTWPPGSPPPPDHELRPSVIVVLTDGFTPPTYSIAWGHSLSGKTRSMTRVTWLLPVGALRATWSSLTREMAAASG